MISNVMATDQLPAELASVEEVEPVVVAASVVDVELAAVAASLVIWFAR